MFYYFNAEMKYYEKPIPTFANTTDEELADMLAKHYADEIDLSTLNGWEVGATRLIHLDAMQAPNPNSSETWPAQDITVVIVDHNHTDLATPINGHTKAALTVQTREVLNNNSRGYDQEGHIYIDGNIESATTFTKWSNLYIRTYLNEKVWGAFPTDFKSLIKPSTHYRHTTYNGSSSEKVTDNLFLPSYPEIFGTESYSHYAPTNPVEGTQFIFFLTASNRIKYGNNNGVSNEVAQIWWEGSASSELRSNYYFWCNVQMTGVSSNGSRGSSRALAPAWAM